MTLRTTQQRFYDLVTAPELVPEGTDVSDVANGDARASGVARLNVYANMYFFRIRDVLAEQFPLLHEALGADGFHNLVTGYLERFPPAHPSLRHIGSRLPTYVAESAHAAHAATALLEWAYIDLFDGPDCELLSAEDLHELSPETLGDLHMRLVPTHRLLPGVLVWRAGTGTQVKHRDLDELEASVLAVCSRDEPTLAAICELLAETLGEEEATTRAFALLSRWFTDGLLRR